MLGCQMTEMITNVKNKEILVKTDDVMISYRHCTMKPMRTLQTTFLVLTFQSLNNNMYEFQVLITSILLMTVVFNSESLFHSVK